MFCEMQKPRPWGADHEQDLVRETIEQAKLADEMGYGCWWEVEHHAAEEFSFSSAPELMLTAIARETEQMRIGHAAVLTPFNINHPIRIAERTAMLDRLSEGRLEVGFARSTNLEWEVFNVDPTVTREQAQQSMEMVPKMWTQDSFSWNSEEWQIEDRNIVPKPLQKPHPPLWQAGSSPTSFARASQNGMGVLGVTLWTPIEEIAERVEIYREAIKTCTPVGEFVNDQVALFTFVHCADTDQEARDNGAAAAAAWYSNNAFRLFQGRNPPAPEEGAPLDIAGGDFVGAFLQQGEDHGDSESAQIRNRIAAGEDVPEDEIYDFLNGQDSLIAGSPETCLEKMKSYEKIGIDRLMCFQQVGPISHEKIMKSIRLVGGLIPEFHGKE